jgi:hypothetical protein
MGQTHLPLSPDGPWPTPTRPPSSVRPPLSHCPAGPPPIFPPPPEFHTHEKLSSPHSLLSLILMFSSSPKLPDTVQPHLDDVWSAPTAGVRHSAPDFTNPPLLPSPFGERQTLHKIPSIDELLTSLLFPGWCWSRPRLSTIAGAPHRCWDTTAPPSFATSTSPHRYGEFPPPRPCLTLPLFILKVNPPEPPHFIARLADDATAWT